MENCLNVVATLDFHFFHALVSGFQPLHLRRSREREDGIIKNIQKRLPCSCIYGNCLSSHRLKDTKGMIDKPYQFEIKLIETVLPKLHLFEVGSFTNKSISNASLISIPNRFI